MARKSRRNQTGVASQPESCFPEKPVRKLAAAAYARLSAENNGHEGEDSIETQIKLIHDYIKENEELQLKDTYVDNGYSGTNFNRPEFERLMNDVRAGRIQCIVVKDLSRFGRDYLETGYYLETIFPKLGVRFIAVTDNFDNSRDEDLDSLAVPIKNIVNGMYAKDISRKLSATYNLKRKRGDLPQGFANYGYLHNDDGTSYVVDDETACYVRMMFQWKLMGASDAKIARRLDFIQAPRPRDKRMGKKLSENAWENGVWTTSSVRRILENPIYAGDLVTGKTVGAAYKGIASHAVPEEEWVVHRDHHEAIVLRPDFDAVQEIRRQRGSEYQRDADDRKNTDFQTVNVLNGIVYCGCCGKPMLFKRVRHPHETEPHLVAACSSPRETTVCGHRRVQEKLLRILVMDQIQHFIKTACDREQMVQELMAAKDDRNKVISLRKKIESLHFQAEQAEQRKMGLYSDYVEGVLDAEDFQVMKERFIEEKQKCEEQAEQYEKQLLRIERKAEALNNQKKHLEQYLNSREFNAALVSELVEAVYIGMDNTIEVRFKCRDAYQEWIECWEEGETDG